MAGFLFSSFCFVALLCCFLGGEGGIFFIVYTRNYVPRKNSRAKVNKRGSWKELDTVLNVILFK